MWSWYYSHSILWFKSYPTWNWVTSSWKEIGLNLLDDRYFTIPYVVDTIPNSPAGHQLLTQAKKNVWIFAINGEDSITAQGALDKLHYHKNWRGSPKSISVYAEGRATRGQILKIFGPYFIKSDLWFHILKFVSQINLSPQGKLVNI